MLHNVVSSILWFFQSSIITEQSRFTLYIFFAQVIHITWIIGSCAHFNFSHCVWIAYTSDPFWTSISTKSSTYFECTTLVKSRMEHFSRYFSITFVMDHRAVEYGVFFINFALSYGYFQSALGSLRSILLAHFWYVRIMLIWSPFEFF